MIGINELRRSAAQPASLNRIVMRAGVIVVAIFLTACAANPRSLCASLVPSTWTYLRRAPRGSGGIESLLPTPPYRTSEGRLVRSVNRLWYEQGDDLTACTVARHAIDNCSVEVTYLTRSGAGWLKVGDSVTIEIEKIGALQNPVANES